MPIQNCTRVVVFFALTCVGLTGCLKEVYVVKNADLTRAQELKKLPEYRNAEVVMPAKVQGKSTVYLPYEDIEVLHKHDMLSKITGPNIYAEHRASAVFAGALGSGVIAAGIKLFSQMLCDDSEGSQCDSLAPSFVLGAVGGGVLTYLLTEPNHRPTPQPQEGWMMLSEPKN